ncbi:MAG: hypothetical protein E7369_04090 [Clostridiales bacterium]|nr:hypothetical protein [Clostridiales bacterium]
MPKITQILVQSNKKDRCSIFVDGEFFAGVSLETAYKFGLKNDMEITAEKLSEIVSEGERTDAMNKAVQYVSKTLKTKKQVKTYLLGKGYQDSTVYYVIDKLKEFKYIDDVEYSKRYIESNKSSGRRLIEYKLMMKGVRKEDIFAAYDSVEIPANENALAVAKKHIKNKELSKENLSKTYRYLVGKGFSYEETEYALSKLKEGE